MVAAPGKEIGGGYYSCVRVGIHPQRLGTWTKVNRTKFIEHNIGRNIVQVIARKSP